MFSFMLYVYSNFMCNLVILVLVGMHIVSTFCYQILNTLMAFLFISV